MSTDQSPERYEGSWSETPTSGAGGWSAPAWPVSGAPDPLDGDPARWQPRIIPSAPPPKSRLILGLLIGFVAGVLVAAPTAYFLAPDNGRPTPAPTSTVASGPAPLGLFEQNQLAVNRPKFHDDLAVLAASWLPFVSNCLLNTDENGPKRGVDERSHVLCRAGNVYVHFAQFKSPIDRDRAREYRQRLNAENRALAPGIAEPARKPRASDPAVGTYIEYALTGPDKKPLAGIWWDSEDDKADAIYVEGNWDRALSGSWQPLRDLWQRHS